VILESLSLFVSGLLAGTFVQGGLGLRPATAHLPAGTHILMRQALIRNLRRVMLPLMLAAVGLAGLTAVGSGRSGDRVLRWLAFLCAGLPLMITRYGSVPLNEQMLTWSPETPPSNLTGVVRRWEAFDTLRAIAAVTAFVCHVGATGYGLTRMDRRLAEADPRHGDEFGDPT
jgi:hypothetical protein